MSFLAPLLIGSLAPTAVVGSAFLAKSLLSLGGSLLLSAAASLLAPKPEVQSFGVRVTQPGAIVPRDIVYGFTRKGGTIVFMDVSDTPGSPSGVLDLVIVVAGHRVHQIGAIYLDGEQAIPAGETQALGRWAGFLGCERALGDGEQFAFPLLRGVKPALWTDNHRLRGCAAVWLRLIYERGVGQDIWPNGLPNITMDVFGKDDILDPRSDTRGYTDNAALCVADYMSDPIYGLGAVIGEDIDEADLIEAANVCDEPVTLASGATERRYTCNGVLTTEASPQSNIQSLLTSMAGTCAFAAGRWHVHAGAYRIPSVSFSANDARPGGIRVITRQSMADNFNAVRGTFVSAENDWQPDDFPAFASSVYLAEDNGERRWKDIALPFTTSAAMAQRLARIDLERQRRQITVEFSGKLKCWQAKVGDTITLNYPRLGWLEKPFEVRGVRLELQDGQLLPVLTLREMSPLVFSWAATEEQIYAAAPRTTLPGPFDISSPGITSATEELYVTRSGDGVKSLVRLTWSASETGRFVVYEVDGAREGGEFQPFGRTSGLSLEAFDITPGKWVFRVRAENILGVRSPWATRDVLVSGLLGAPVAISGASIQSAGGLAILKWDLHADLDVRIGGQIVIRHSTAVTPSWQNSVSVDEVAGGMTIGVVPLMPGSYLLRARDSSGVLGPAAVLGTDGLQAVPFVSIGTLQEDDDFLGVGSNTAAVTGALQLNSDVLISSHASIAALPSIAYPTSVVAGQGVYNFATNFDFGVVKTVRLRRELDVVSLSILDRIGTRVGNVSGWQSFGGALGAEADVWIEVATTNDNPGGTPVWSDWRLVENDEITARGVKARAILTTDDLAFTPRVFRMRLHADEVA